MRRALRLALAALGIAASVYGAASLTGGWLGTPPWWGEWRTVEAGLPGWAYAMERPRLESIRFSWDSETGAEGYYPRGGREAKSGALLAAGLGLAAFALWPGKPHEEVPKPPLPPSA